MECARPDEQTAAPLRITAIAAPIEPGLLLPLRSECFDLRDADDSVAGQCDITVPPSALVLQIRGIYYLVDLPDLLTAAIHLYDGAGAAAAVPEYSIPDDAWREVHARSYSGRMDLSFIFRPDPPTPNIVDVRGDVSHGADTVHCRFGINIKCASGHELQLRGDGRDREAARAAAEAAYPRLAAWAGSLAGK